jgi:hypothetical protein
MKLAAHCPACIRDTVEAADLPRTKRRPPRVKFRILFLALAVQLLSLGKAHAQHAYVTHPNTLFDQRATVAVLTANPLRAFVYCVIVNPGKGETLAPSVVTMGNGTNAVPVYFPDRRPQLWANSGKVWAGS